MPQNRPAVNDLGSNKTGFLFHVTMSGRVESIASDGLQVGSTRSIGSPALDHHCGGRIFLSDAEGLDFWHNRAESFAVDGADDFLDEGFVPFVLRVNACGLRLAADTEGTKDSGHAAWFTEDEIQAERIEAWDGAHWVKCDSNEIHFDQALDEEGCFRENNPLLPPVKDRLVQGPSPLPQTPTEARSRTIAGELERLDQSPTFSRRSPGNDR